MHEDDRAVDEVNGLRVEWRQIPPIELNEVDVLEPLTTLSCVPQHVGRYIGRDPLANQRRDRRSDPTDARTDLKYDVVGVQASRAAQQFNGRVAHRLEPVLVGVASDGDFRCLYVLGHRFPRALVVRPGWGVTVLG